MNFFDKIRTFDAYLRTRVSRLQKTLQIELSKVFTEASFRWDE